MEQALISKKSHFAKTEVNYLGMIINGDGIKPDISRLGKFKDSKPPKTIRQLRKLLGYINWFRPFIRTFHQKLFT